MHSCIHNIHYWYLNTPNKEALIVKKKSFSYGELFENIWRVKIILEQEFDINDQHSVILAANKSESFVFIYFALHLIGAKVIPLDEEIVAERIAFICKETQPNLIIGLKNFNLGTKSIEFDQIFINRETEIPTKINFPDLDRIADILFTTGTTGKPKGVLLSHRNISQSVININSFIGNDSTDKELLALPVSHSFGLTRLRCVLSSGGTLVLLGSVVNIKRLFRTFDEFNVSGFSMVPSSWRYIKKMSDSRISHFSKQLKYIELGSAYLSPEEKIELTEFLPNTRLCMHYGLTEASRSTFIEFNSETSYLQTIGRASPNVYIKILDTNGKEVSRGSEGEICITGPHVARDYVNANYEDLFYNDYFRTGDIGSISEEGYIRLLGRSKELINVGGKKVSPMEIEDKITAFNKNLEAACIGVDDPNGILGEVVKAFIVKDRKSSISLTDISNYLKEHLEGYKLPVIYEWIPELPKTSSGKLQRQKLK